MINADFILFRDSYGPMRIAHESDRCVDVMPHWDRAGGVPCLNVPRSLSRSALTLRWLCFATPESDTLLRILFQVRRRSTLLYLSREIVYQSRPLM